MKMSLPKLSKKELKQFAESSDAWQVRDRMGNMLNEIENTICTLNLAKTDYNRNRLCGSVVIDRILSSFTLDLEYRNKEGKLDKITIKQTGAAPLNISDAVNQVALLSKLTTRAIAEVNKEGYLTNKKLIKKLDKVLHLGREYLKSCSEVCSDGEAKWIDDVIAELTWTPNANLRVLAMLKAAKKMEKALEGVKEHFEIEPIENTTVEGRPLIGLTFNRLSDDIELNMLDSDINLIAKLVVSPIKAYLDTECPELPEAVKDRILQSRFAVLALIQVRPRDTKLFEEVNKAILAVMMG